MMPPAASGPVSPNTTPRKRTCEPSGDGCGAMGVRSPITPIKTASFARLVLRRSPNNSGEKKGPALAFGRALRELGIKRIAAKRPQAKGRIERLFETLQDRLVKMRLAGIATLDAANHFLET